MNDTQLAVNRIGNESKISELTPAAVATVSGGYYAYCPAPTAPALYSDEVFTPGYWPGQHPAV